MVGGRRRGPGRMGGDVLIEVAWLYYQDGLNQKEIADRLGLSRATVVNHLQEARAQGLIRISLAAPAFVQHRLAVALCERFGLRAAYVLPDEGLAEEEQFRRVVAGGAMWLPSLLGPGDRLGVAWGRTVHDLAEAVEPSRVPDLTVLQLVGSMATPYGFTAEACSTLLAQQLGARCVNIFAPAILSRPELAEELRAEPILRAQLDQIGTVNKFLFSTGTAGPDSHIVLSGLATAEDLRRNVAKGAAGVICGRFVDESGRAVPDVMEERMIGVPLPRLVGLEMGIMVTPGHDKVLPSLAAIRGGYVTHLVTGASVAEAMLSA
ncbi:sugar-binding transcriptional regulator [Rubellimicrobium roseum]|uniref:Sugar-binding transcriptional regulator n=1 Tax=Rubellimicrobium roseum TaxID=687525 RepID=A0A5C4NAE1_9RHOB|nr:sugar-binding transcriptional regulator [Rubellimicrobium roseum]TNC68532.1 sugar-binding transcriptional regulator [Rubellimicrobium roseum]